MRHLVPCLLLALLALTACHQSSGRTRLKPADSGQDEPRLDADAVQDADPALEDATDRGPDSDVSTPPSSDGAADAAGPWLACKDRRGKSFCAAGERVRCDEQGVLEADPCPDGLPCREVQGMVFCATDVDECALKLDDCSDNATCIDTADGYRCACPDGFAGAGVGLAGCYDVDECAATSGYGPCGSGYPDPHTCTNTPGSYTCTCAPGYVGTGSPRCDDLDECARDGDAACGPGAECFNTDGSFGCRCQAPYLQNQSYFANPKACHQRAWGTARLVSNDQGDARWPAISLNAADGSQSYAKAIVWEQFSGTHLDVWINGDDWYDREDDPHVSTAALLDSESGDARSPGVAMYAGHTFAAWVQAGPTRAEVWTRDGREYREFATAERPGDASHVRVSVARYGARVAWQAGSAPNAAIWADSPSHASSMLGQGTRPAIAASDDQGHARVVWLTQVPRTLVSRKYQYGGDGWLGVELVSDDVADDDADITTTSDGHGMITWRSAEPASLPMARYVAMRGPFSFGTVVPLDDRLAKHAPRVASAPGGNAVAVWIGDGDVLRAAQFTLSQGWTRTDLDAHADGSIVNAAVKMDANGNGLAVWVRHSAGISTLWAAHFIDGTWQERIPVATSALLDPMLSMDMNSAGRAGVVWVDRDASGMSRIWFRPFE